MSGEGEYNLFENMMKVYNKTDKNWFLGRQQFCLI